MTPTERPNCNPDAQASLAAPSGSANFRVHDALGNWMIEDRQMGRMIAMSTRERDAKFIAEALNAYSPNETGQARRENPQSMNTEPTPQPPASPPLPAPAGSDQDAIDWKVFSELYARTRGFHPNARDKMHRELFHWFTAGAHNETMGRLTPAPNDQAQPRSGRE